MRTEDPQFDAEQMGTTSGDTLRVEVIRGGEDALDRPLDVVSWSLNWNADRQIQGQADITIVDEDGTLAPWRLSDPIAPGGSKLVITWVSGTSEVEVPLGIWRIRSVEPQETWRIYRYPGATVRVPGGGNIKITADEEPMCTATLERMDAEEAQASTVVGEIERLLEDLAAVELHEDVSDGNLPHNFVYDVERMDAIEDLLETRGAVYRGGPDGSLEVVPRTGVPTNFTLAGGDGGILIDLQRKMTDEGIYNGVVSSSETEDGLPLIGRAYIEGGPLEWGGPFGSVPLFHESIATTGSGVQAGAETLLETRRKSGEVVLPVECITHPGLQIHDLVTLIAPSVNDDHILTGRVVGMVIQSVGTDAGSVPSKRMELEVAVASRDLEVIAGRGL